AGAEFKKNTGVIKDFFGWLERKVLSPGANKDGLISRFIGLQADSIRKLFNIREKPSGDGAGGPDLKAMAAAAAKAEAQAAKAERVKKLEADLARAQDKNDFERLSREGKINQLYEDRRKLIEIMGKTTDEEQRVRAAIGVEKIDEQLRGLERAKDV